MNGRKIAAGVAGGMLAGAAVGLVEAVSCWAGTHGKGELPAIAWALLAYGCLGALAGLGAALVAGILRADAFALAVAGTAGVLGVVVGRFRIIRDVFLEQAPRGPLALMVQLVILAAVVGLAAVVWRTLRGAEARARVLTRPAVAAAGVVLLAGSWSVGVRLLSGAATPPPQVARPAATPGAPNLVLLMIDTLRADHLSAYGYGAGHTPNIDALAATSTRFTNAFAQASWTRPSVATMLTGLYPSSHGAVHKADVLPDRIDTLPELLSRAGYYTVGFANNVNVSAAFNFGQGYAEYRYLAPDFFFLADEASAKLALYNVLRLVRERFLARRISVYHYYQPAEVVTREVRQWLTQERLPEPFFLFVHYMDPHDPYFVHPFNGEGYARVANPNPPAAVADLYRRLYDGGISYLDEHLGALLGELRTRGLYDHTLILLTGDHGEEFHEHGGWWHGTTLYDEQLHIPLIVKPPHPGAAGAVVDELATHLDIAPTMLAAAKLSAPATMQGHVLPLDGGPAPERDRIFAEEDFEGNVLSAVRTRDWKLIAANPGNPRGLQPEELYDLARDPREQMSMVAQDPPELATLRTTLRRATVEARTHAGTGEQRAIDDVTRERLRALGYVN